ncbi:MAG: hypothetical protein ACOYN4_08525 [Bacteroidales bacterium]
MIRLFLILSFLFARNGTTHTTATNSIDKELKSKCSKLRNPVLSDNVSKKLSHQHNNPGNLRCNRTGDFIIYKTLEEGYAALLYDLDLKISGRSAYTDSTTTIHDFIAIYAPAFENDVNAFLRLFCNETGLLASDLLGTQKIEVVARGIIKVENVDLYHKLYSAKQHKQSN